MAKSMAAGVQCKGVGESEQSRYLVDDENIDHLQFVRDRIAAAESKAHDVCNRGDAGNQVGECRIRESLARRENQTKDWVKNLRDEIHALTHEHCVIEQFLAEAMNQYRRFENTLRASRSCMEYRQNLEGLHPDDPVNVLLDKEIASTNAALGELDVLIHKLRNDLGMMEMASVKLQDELKLKVGHVIALKSCQQVKPLLSRPYDPEALVRDYEPGNEYQWNQAISDVVNSSMDLRMECRDIMVVFQDIDEKFKARLSSDLEKTNEALRQQIYRDEHTEASLQELLRILDKNINSSRLRVGVFHDEFDRQVRQSLLETWRLQRMATRPGKEHIFDKPSEALNDEYRQIQSRIEEIVLNNKSDQKLWEDLEKLRTEVIGKLNFITSRLFANRECCQGMRRVTFIS